jgi:aspartate dehydrogenase
MGTMKKIGIVGCGTIGRYLAEKINADLREQASLVGVCDANEKAARKLVEGLSLRCRILGLEELIRATELVIECSVKESAAEICRKAISAGRDVMAMSVGGLIDDPDLFSLARKKGCSIILPSGAICGLDGIKSAGIGEIRSVSLTTRKPPQGLRGAPFIVENGIDLDSIVGEKIIFEGSAEQAIGYFPKNINVSALLSIAGIGAQKTRVKIVTSPDYTLNTHEVEVEGTFGRLVTRTENVPFPENPKTSFLAALSAVATLKQILDSSIRLGT